MYNRYASARGKSPAFEISSRLLPSWHFQFRVAFRWDNQNDDVQPDTAYWRGMLTVANRKNGK